MKSVAGTLDRANQAEAAMASLGVTLQQILWSVGPYDIITIYDADESATAALLALAAGGNIRSTTMRAHDADAMGRILAKLG